MDAGRLAKSRDGFGAYRVSFLKLTAQQQIYVGKLFRNGSPCDGKFFDTLLADETSHEYQNSRVSRYSEPVPERAASNAGRCRIEPIEINAVATAPSKNPNLCRADRSLFPQQFSPLIC